MTDIVEFVEARIREDERRALDAGEDDRGDWGLYWDGLGDDGNRDVKTADGVHVVHAAAATGPFSEDKVQPNAEQAEHIARWDPKRVLAEVEAKRRIVKDIVSNGYLSEPRPGFVSSMVTDGLAVRVLEYLALPYADHPDYRESWRP